MTTQNLKGTTAKFYQANLVLVVPTKLYAITKGQSVAERLGDEEGKCPSCGKNKWWLLPKECVAVRTGGKPYIECLECGYQTHL